MLSPQLIAQRTVTNRLCPSCRPYEQYQINAQGNRHGTYKTWNRQGRLIHESNWSNGVEHGRNIDYDSKTGAIQRDAMMHNGQMTSLKVYSYNLEGTKRSLVREETWLKDGTILTSREFDPVYNKWIESAGKLSNGRFWYDKYGYNEKYNANDTVYVWSNKYKEIFEGKYLDGIRLYTKEETMIMKEQAIQDSIAYVKELEEIDKIYLE